MPILTLMVALGFAAIHLFIGKLRFLDVIPRSRWLSFAGGVAVAYIFLHVLPELSGHQRSLQEASAAAVGIGERGIYLVALVGLAVFYGLERVVKSSQRPRHKPADEATASPGVFWIHIGSFGIYNLLIGYLLVHREEAGVWPLLLYAVAMALHFVTNDFGLREDHQSRYDAIGRWPLAAAVLLGWLMGVAMEMPPSLVAVPFAFLAGGIVLNVLKEELPEERESRFLPFAAGSAWYAILLLLPA